MIWLWCWVVWCDSGVDCGGLLGSVWWFGVVWFGGVFGVVGGVVGCGGVVGSRVEPPLKLAWCVSALLFSHRHICQPTLNV